MRRAKWTTTQYCDYVSSTTSDFDVGVGHLRDSLLKEPYSRPTSLIHGASGTGDPEQLRDSLAWKTLYLSGMGTCTEGSKGVGSIVQFKHAQPISLACI